MIGKKRKLSYATYTGAGNREINEDSLGTFACEDGRYGFVLCDGLGGHGMGDVASSLVVEVFRSQFYKIRDIESYLGQSFQAAQDVLMAEQKARGASRKMKTTAVAVVTDGKTVHIGHIGDSRVYVFDNNKIRTRTLDHSIPQMLAVSGDIKESEIRGHKDRNILLRVLGIDWEEPMYELMRPIPLRKCQAILCCSDGFWELIDEEKMCDLLKSSSTANEWIEKMKRVVLTNGVGKNMDNNSAIAIWYK